MNGQNRTTTRDGEIVEVLCRIPGRATLIKSDQNGTRWVPPAYARATPAERAKIQGGEHGV